MNTFTTGLAAAAISAAMLSVSSASLAGTIRIGATM